MNSIYLVLSLALLATVAYSQVPVPCITPPQWEARYFAYDPYKSSTIRAHISYDAIYKRERIIEEFQLGKEDDFYDVLYLHNQQVEYRFNLKTKECQRQAITRPWVDVGIPANATNLGESYIGSAAVPGGNLLVTIWRNKFTDSKGNEIDYLGTWTYEACLPVTATYFSQADNINLHSSYFDITPGLDDPNVFVPRKECLSSRRK